MTSRIRRAGVAFALLGPWVMAGALAAATMMASPGVRAQTALWPDTTTARLQVLALIQTLRADILATRSATATLEQWCRDHALAADPKVVARPLPGPGPAPTVEQRRRLAIDANEEVRYRRVQLRCGERVLSHAENWYVPGRLSPEMNRLLATTDMSYGRVIEPLQPHRVTLDAEMLWRPLPLGWERERDRHPAVLGRTIDIPDALFLQASLVYGADGRPLAEVREIYQRDLLAFAPPPSR